MTKSDNSTSQSNHPVSLVKPMLVGGGIALLVISFFVFRVDEANPAWGKSWMIRPLIITPLAEQWVVRFTLSWLIIVPAVSTTHWLFS
jgi:hypothetical protein